MTDRKRALQALQRCRANLSKVKSLLCGGYVDKPFAQGVRDLQGKHVKRSERHPFKVMPKRRIVERNFAWLEKNWRLWKNCERWLNTSLQFVHLAFLTFPPKDFERALRGKCDDLTCHELHFGVQCADNYISESLPT